MPLVKDAMICLESQNQLMVVHIQNPYEGMKAEEVDSKMISERTFMGWPFMQEGSAVAVSDSSFKYEKMTFVPGSLAKVASNPHVPQGLGHSQMKADRIEQVYSKRSGVITGSVDIPMHVLHLKG